MRMTVIGLLFLILPTATAASTPGTRFQLQTWGMPGSPRFTVTLSRVGDLTVVRELQERAAKRAVKRLSPDKADALARMAEMAVDFSSGCGAVADGTSARMTVETQIGPTTRLCEMAGRWPLGEKTKLFIDSINSYLPMDLHVF